MTSNTNKTSQGENVLSDLDKRQMIAIEMKYEGFTSKETADVISNMEGMDSVTDISVRAWFSKQGKLHDYYRAYAEEETKKRRSQAHDTFKAHLNNAVRTLVHVMNKSKLDVARVQAAKEIINRQLGEPLKVVAVDDGRVNELLSAIKKADEETISGDDGHREDSSSS